MRRLVTESWGVSPLCRVRKPRTPRPSHKESLVVPPLWHLSVCALASPRLLILQPSCSVPCRCTCFLGSLPKTSKPWTGVPLGWAWVCSHIPASGKWREGTSASLPWLPSERQGPHNGEFHQEKKGIFRVERVWGGRGWGGRRRRRRRRRWCPLGQGTNFAFVNHEFLKQVEQILLRTHEPFLNKLI